MPQLLRLWWSWTISDESASAGRAVRLTPPRIQSSAACTAGAFEAYSCKTNEDGFRVFDSRGRGLRLNARAALGHDGREYGGRFSSIIDEEVGAPGSDLEEGSDNYLGELIALIDVLQEAGAAADSTVVRVGVVQRQAAASGRGQDVS